jgi:hypothetical protein
MKTKIILGSGVILLLLLAAGLVPLAGAQKDGRINYKKDIFIDRAGEQSQLVAWGGTVVVEGKIRKDVLVVGSEVTISGDIGDSFVGLGARVLLKPTAVIHGDLVILGGTLVREDGSQVKGDTVYFKSEDISSKFLKEGIRGFFSFSILPFFLILKFVSLFIWVILAVIVAGLFPKNVTLAAAELRRGPAPILGIGLIASIAFAFLVLFSAILCIILIGIPIVMTLALAGIVIKVFGRVVCLFVIGESLAKAFHKPAISPIAGAMLGLIAVGLIGFIPIIGFLFSLFLSLFGWGVAIRTKFGTTGNWFRRVPVSKGE